jgi:hypothetical protein
VILYNGALCLQTVVCIAMGMREHKLLLCSGCNIALFYGAAVASEQAESCNLYTNCNLLVNEENIKNNYKFILKQYYF